MKKLVNLLLLLATAAMAQEPIMSGGVDDGGPWLWELKGDYSCPATLPYLNSIGGYARFYSAVTIGFGTWKYTGSLGETSPSVTYGINDKNGTLDFSTSWLNYPYGFQSVSIQNNNPGQLHLYKKKYVQPLEIKLTSSNYTAKKGDELQVAAVVTGGSSYTTGSGVAPSWLERVNKYAWSGRCYNVGNYSIAVVAEDNYTGEKVSATADITITEDKIVDDNGNSSGGGSGNTGSGGNPVDTGGTGGDTGSDGSGGSGGDGVTNVGDGSSGSDSGTGSDTGDNTGSENDSGSGSGTTTEVGGDSSGGTGNTDSGSGSEATPDNDGNGGSTTEPVTEVGDGSSTDNSGTGNQDSGSDSGTGDHTDSPYVVSDGESNDGGNNSTPATTTTTVTDDNVQSDTETRSADYALPLLVGTTGIALGLDASMGKAEPGPEAKPESQQSAIIWDMRSSQ